MVSPRKLETGLRTISAGFASISLLGIEAFGFPTFGLLLYDLPLLMTEILHYLKDRKLRELWYTPYYG